MRYLKAFEKSQVYAFQAPNLKAQKKSKLIFLKSSILPHEIFLIFVCIQIKKENKTYPIYYVGWCGVRNIFSAPSTTSQ